jgi:cytochrome P450 / NADPH-cytochrome P450 reductase
MGLSDASKGNMYGDFENWLDASLWPNLHCEDSIEPGPVSNVEISTNARASNLRYDVHMATVKENSVLTAEGQPTKCHMEIELPPDSAYQCGDYLAVLPLNSEKKVKEIMAHFNLPGDAVITIKATGPSTIPTNSPLSVFDVLRSYVELSQPATKKTLKVLVSFTHNSADKTALQDLVGDDTRFEQEITEKRTSLFSLLVRYPSIKLPFGDFLDLLPPLQIRQYSISSSPLADLQRCTITYGVIDAESHSDPQQRFEGVTGGYLRGLKAGDSIQVSIRPTAKKTFRLPVDPAKTPLLMYAAGTGLAPFRGFLQERALQLEHNPDRRLAPALLFLGCRSQTGDRLYAKELDEWAKAGVVDIRYAFSQEKTLSNGCGHVPDRMLEDQKDIIDIWRSGARVYLCGTRNFAEGVREAATKIAVMAKDSMPQRSPAEMAELERRFREALQDRVASDVFD